MAIDISLLNNYGLLGLLLITFLAFTILPLPYEPAVFLSLSTFNPYYVLIFSLAGSILGSVVNYYIGYKGFKRLLPSENSQWYKKASSLFQKYGEKGVLFLNWVPFIGDPLVVLSGSFGMKFWKFLVYVFVGRFVYFSLVVWLGYNLYGVV